nr:hypothetical protein [Tanacetum cinerariifolium]
MRSAFDDLVGRAHADHCISNDPVLSIFLDAPTTAKSVSDPDPLSYAKPQPHPELDIAQSSKKMATVIPAENVATMEVQGLFSAKSPKSGKLTSFPFVDGSPGGIYQPGYLTFKHKSRAKKIKASFEEFQKYEDDMVEQHCAEMDARLDKLSVDFDEELYPHMLTAIAGRRWVIGHGLTVKGMSEGLKHGIEHGKADRDLATVEAYDPKADSKYVKALQDLKDLKSDGILVYVPTIAPRGLAILLSDAATQNKVADKEDEPHPRL